MLRKWILLAAAPALALLLVTAPPSYATVTSELPGSGLSPMLLASLGGYLLTAGLALLLVRR